MESLARKPYVITVILIRKQASLITEWSLKLTLFTDHPG